MGTVLAEPAARAELELTHKIASRTAHVVVMGLGYVGLPLAMAFAEAGLPTIGLESDAAKLSDLRAGKMHLPNVRGETLLSLVQTNLLELTHNPEVLAKADVVVVCVPTPLTEAREPDLSPISTAIAQIAEHLVRPMLVVLESTTYPGTTEELVVPRLQRADFRVGSELFVAYSPERVDPGNTEYHLKNTPKVIAGVTPQCLRLAQVFYQCVVAELVPVSSPATAEMVKLLENTFRAVNIALANEMALISRKLGVDPFEVVRAAATKPFGYMPFYPGPGLGGHCIPVDPLYLSWKLRELRYEAKLIELSDTINRSMPSYVVERLAGILLDLGQEIASSKLLVYGVAYKPNVADVRESPGITLISVLLERGAEVHFADPLISQIVVAGRVMLAQDHALTFTGYAAVLLVTAHDALDRERLLREAAVIMDTRGVLADVSGAAARVFRL